MVQALAVIPNYLGNNAAPVSTACKKKEQVVRKIGMEGILREALV